MLLKVNDALGVQQTITANGVEAPLDHSSTIAATGVAQTLLVANTLRSGWFMQNRGSNVMYVNDLGAATTGAGSFAVQPGATFPPVGYPLTGNAISVLGTLSDVYTVREW